MKTLVANRTLLGVLLLLVVVVLVPTAGVLWFMTAAVRNERAAVRETLTTAYRSQLVGLQQRLRAAWADKRAELASVDQDRPPAEVFAELIRTGLVDSVVRYDDAGEALYPRAAEPRRFSQSVESTAWLEAQRLEFSASKLDSAAAAYGRIARGASDVDFAARALQAQARCLGKAGRKEDAAAILTGALAEPRFAGAMDGQGRLIAPDGWLLVLRLIEDTTSTNYLAAADLLHARLENYGAPVLPVAQRRFLMRQLQELLPERPPPDTLAAEDLAARYLESGLRGVPGAGLGRSGLDGVWQLVAGHGRVVALYREDTIRAELAALARASVPIDVEIELLSPGTDTSGPPAFLSVAAKGDLPGWRLSLYLTDQEAVNSAADAQVAAYLWTGVLLIAVIAVLAFIIARMIGRQIRVTKLKNDLIATVSHELKTPLASMRLLVDTLLDEQHHDERQVREYLELISKENLRLSRLIEDFLSFSRMERNKQAFEKKEVSPSEIATAAADAVSVRFDPAHCRFDVDITPDLPDIVADPDAVTTVIVNLLDNAYKYTKDEKHIVLKTYGENRHVCFSVQDNGIGLSRRVARKVFDRFFQVDQRLSRSVSGVGLGLSIVKFIVDAHGGIVGVDSQPGEGSTFTIKLPATRPTAGVARHQGRSDGG